MVHARAQPKLKERNFLADVRRREARCSVREERVGVREEKVPAINGAAVSLAAFSADTAAKAAKLAQRQLEPRFAPPAARIIDGAIRSTHASPPLHALPARNVFDGAWCDSRSQWKVSFGPSSFLDSLSMAAARRAIMAPGTCMSRATCGQRRQGEVGKTSLEAKGPLQHLTSSIP